jgi:GNAT superfamily N-acetyltransferase
MIRVRSIHRRDLNRVWEFLKLCFRTVNRETLEYQRPRSKKRFLEVYEEEGVEQLLFELASEPTSTEIVGYAECAFEITGSDNWMNESFFTRRDMRPMFVEELAVHPGYQGRGVGSSPGAAGAPRARAGLHPPRARGRGEQQERAAVLPGRHFRSSTRRCSWRSGWQRRRAAAAAPRRPPRAARGGDPRPGPDAPAEEDPGHVALALRPRRGDAARDVQRPAPSPVIRWRDPRVRILAVALFAAYAWFFQGGGWNQNTRLALTRAVVEQQSLRIDATARVGGRLVTGDYAERDGHYYSDKAPGSSLGRGARGGPGVVPHGVASHCGRGHLSGLRRHARDQRGAHGALGAAPRRVRRGPGRQRDGRPGGPWGLRPGLPPRGPTRPCCGAPR